MRAQTGNEGVGGSGETMVVVDVVEEEEEEEERRDEIQKRCVGKNSDRPGRFLDLRRCSSTQPGTEYQLHGFNAAAVSKARRTKSCVALHAVSCSPRLRESGAHLLAIIHHSCCCRPRPPTTTSPSSPRVSRCWCYDPSSASHLPFHAPRSSLHRRGARPPSLYCTVLSCNGMSAGGKARPSDREGRRLLG